MKADFVLKEIIYNTIMSGRIMHVKNAVDGVYEKKIIDFIKVVPATTIIQIHFKDGTIAEASTDKEYSFEVSKDLKWKKSTRKKL